jgi:transcriptional regulator with XRE-family HTH domain
MKLSQPYNIEIRDVLRLRREELKMTQESLAKTLGVTPMAISHFEVGRRDLKLVTLERFATALELEVDISLTKLYPRRASNKDTNSNPT